MNTTGGAEEGALQDTGIGKGKNYAVNFPLRDGITDEAYKSVFEPVSSRARRRAWIRRLITDTRQ